MHNTQDLQARQAFITQESAFVQQLAQGMHTTIIGQDHLIRSLLIGLLADGHILLEGVPGLAKTLAITTLAKLINADYSRIQFTPDLLPADLVGTLIYSQKNESFSVKKGPIFANFVLADEINRAPAKVQSALLEAMQERQVTLGETTYPLPAPFLVMATQNPIEQEGTYQLPEAQVDRFLLKVILDYPNPAEELEIVKMNLERELPKIQPVIGASQILKAREAVQQVYIDDKVLQYIVDIVMATRRTNQEGGVSALQGMINYGASPRASISLAAAARAYAFIEQRAYVLPEDVRAVCGDVLRHRLGMSYEAEAVGMTADAAIAGIVNEVAVP